MVAGHLSPHTRRAYAKDAQDFTNWLKGEGLTLQTLSRSHMLLYRRYLDEHFAKASAARKLVVARKLLEEAVERGILPHNPARKVPGYHSAGQQETPRHALDKDEARSLLKAIDTTTRQGKRDFAMVLLLIRTGIRRSECAGLQLGDLSQELGHNVMTLRHTKGDKRRKVKVPVDVIRAIEDYLEACGRSRSGEPPLPSQAPLFIQFHKGDKPTALAISDQLIARVVEGYAKTVGLKLSPHSLRATFVTLALEGGARLDQVQYAVGHADPRTTERYQKRKLNLDRHAVDFVQL
jgi:site-specific recombinase XerD